MEGLDATRIHRGLEGRVRILGIEFFDIVLVFFFASVMNLFFVDTWLHVWMVYALPGALGGVLVWGKRGKPDKWLFHFLRYHVTPGCYGAGSEGRQESGRKGRIV